MDAERVVFRGRVQGVGFRYTVQAACEHRGLAGWVRNRDDGTVEALLQGDRQAIEDALNEIQESRSRYIRHVQRAAMSPETLSRPFEIRFS